MILYVTAWAGFTYTGAWTWLTAFIAFVVMPVAELLLPQDHNNLDETEEAEAISSKAYDRVLYVFVVLQYTAVYLFLRSVQANQITTADLAGRIVTMGILCGTFGINVGHELGHRINKREQLLAKLSLLSSLYLHFTIEHNKGHHKYVATPEDPTSARRGENLYRFWLRSMWGTAASAWRIAEKDRKSEKKGILQNEMLQFQCVHVLFCLLIGVAFGWMVMLYFMMAAVIGILLLSTINYIEHYGLVREPTGANSFERAMPHHSWNSNHTIGRYMLFELSRHSDHHYLASRKYQVLRHHEDSPELPTGYPGSMLLSLVPPLWFRVMNRKIEEIESRVKTYPQ